MKELINETLKLIPSKTMREYLAVREDFHPTVEELISIAGICCGYGAMAKYLAIARGYVTDEKTLADIDEYLKCAERANELLANKDGRYVFGWRENEDANEYTFEPTLEEALEHAQLIALFDAEDTEEPLFDFMFDENGEPFDCWAADFGREPLPPSKPAERYVKLPHPFRMGDVVKHYDHTIEEIYGYDERYVILNAEQPDPAPELTRKDMVVTVLHYEYRDKCTPEYLKARKSSEKPDEITLFAHTMGLLFIEMYEEE